MDCTPAGCVEEIAPGLMKGYVTKFAIPGYCQHVVDRRLDFCPDECLQVRPCLSWRTRRQIRRQQRLVLTPDQSSAFHCRLGQWQPCLMFELHEPMTEHLEAWMQPDGYPARCYGPFQIARTLQRNTKLEMTSRFVRI